MVYWTFVNDTASGGGPTGTIATTSLAIGDDSGTGDATTSIDYTAVLVQTNFTATSGFVGGESGETITFSGTGDTGSETGDLMVTVVCQSGSTPALSP